ncbi:phosphoenolpyruvate mutase [Methanocorpusculum sp. MG]|uniref:phosphoenolpyruvate mutase n=1 Tax=Methanocorpusculum petauri TaxID=3002863 RepID=A0ABT4IGE7_9EURY|nr:phosphoenolpyruvate mutase [Methanocorpusculum petauri]MCZ0860815.1 phosphoenolpyruvate mutase [Methanocorpusculum petauri]
MKAVILNSGMGRRMGALTKDHPKCMTELSPRETILSRQLNQLVNAGISDVVITTGLFDTVLMEYCHSLSLPVTITFIKNPVYDQTNYIYSLYSAKDHLHDDIILMHGDLVFENIVLDDLLEFPGSCMIVSSTAELPEKDFKAVVKDNQIRKIGIEFFDHALAAQPFYKLQKSEWKLWLTKISEYCEAGNTGCYAENAFNEISDKCVLYPLDIKNLLCSEIDTSDDLAVVSNRVADLAKKSVYMCFSTDVIHGGHINIINKAAKLGSLTVGILTDEVIASFKRFPILSFEDRKKIIQNIKGVVEVIPQNTLSYAENLRNLHPDYVVHGDEWKTGFQRPIRDEVIVVLQEYGGELIEYPYSKDRSYALLENRVRDQLAVPEARRGRLRKLLGMKKTVTVIEAHSGITGLIAENTTVLQDGKAYQFDGMWVSSLCDSTAKGKPDIELVDISSRMRTIDDIMEVTTKPIILDGDTGGLIEHFTYNIRTMERVGVSAVIIEDKTGLKKNSLFGTDVDQTQDTIENFSAKIAAGKRALKTKEFMLIARIESLILEKGMTDALTRAFAYVAAGADGIMIHSRKKDPTEIFTFCDLFREKDATTPLVVVPTSFNTVTEEEFSMHGVNIVIYANQLTRSGIPVMENVAKTILTHHRAKEADDMCMPISEILTLIPSSVFEEEIR